MDDAMHQVKSRNSPIRDLLPFYTMQGLGLAVILSVGIYAATVALHQPTAPSAAGGALLGMAIVGLMSKPAMMVVRAEELDRVKNILGRLGYAPQPTGEWAFQRARWLRWVNSKVDLNTHDGLMRVTGPANILRGVRNALLQP